MNLYIYNIRLSKQLEFLVLEVLNLDLKSYILNFYR